MVFFINIVRALSVYFGLKRLFHKQLFSNSISTADNLADYYLANIYLGDTYR